MKYLLTAIGVLIYSYSTAQILNVDREIGGDSTKKKITGNTITSFSSDKLRGNLIDLSNKSEIDKFFKNNYILVAQLNNDITILKNEILQNEGYFQLRLRDNDKRKYSIESYLQYQWNGTLGMEYRNVIGSNFRIKLFDKENKDLYFGIGIFHENERWNFNAVETIPNNEKRYRNLYRLNNYIKYAYKLNEVTDITLLTYFQLPINKNFSNVRWYLESNAQFKITNNISLILHWDHTLDNYRVVPISNYYYSSSIGMQFGF